jgi:hypothetical protein
MIGGSSTHDRDANAYRILAGKSAGKRSLGRTRFKWTDNTRMNVTYRNRV